LILQNTGSATPPKLQSQIGHRTFGQCSRHVAQPAAGIFIAVTLAFDQLGTVAADTKLPSRP
jgi:hypothetical protein